MLDRRKLHRDRTYLGGLIAFDYRGSALECLVRNLSEDGAKVVFSDGAAVPAEFELTIHRKGESRRAQVVWRDETQAGIRFSHAEDGGRVSLETAQCIKKLEAERNALAWRVAQPGGPT
jgi:PilZ domain